MRRRYVFDAQRCVNRCVYACASACPCAHVRSHTYAAAQLTTPEMYHPNCTFGNNTPNTFIPIPFCGMSFACDAHRTDMRCGRTTKRAIERASKVKRASERVCERTSVFSFFSLILENSYIGSMLSDVFGCWI